MSARMISGFGQHHTDEADASKPNKVLKPYATITWPAICALVDAPQQVDKTAAQWLIASTLPSRSFRTQEQHGVFHLLWADYDEGTLTLSQVADALPGIIGDADFEIYTSRSATEQRQKCRILVLLARPLSGAEWVLVQEVLNDRLQAAGIEPDRASERPAQLCFLPNRGKFYASRSQRDGVLFDPTSAWADLIAEKRQKIEREAAELEAIRTAARTRRAALKLTDAPDTIGTFNAAYSAPEILSLAGYDQRGDSFRHPASESGSYSASVKDGRVHSLSSNDPLYTKGGGVGAHDAFSAFCVLFADNDRDAALKLAGDEWIEVDGVPYNEARKRQPKSKAMAFDGDVDALFSDVVLREKDVLKMAEAVFLYPNLIVRGHLAGYVSPPNDGKTTLFTFISEVLSRAGLKVIYINVDGSSSDLKRHHAHATEHGYVVVAPDARDGKTTADVLEKLKAISAGNHPCNDYVFIIDTLKKFVDVINKTQAKEFYRMLRTLSVKGATVCLLGHTNKYRDADGKTIYEGTGDLRSDVDELIYFDSAKDAKTGHLIVTTRPDKVRAAFRPISFSIDLANDRKVTPLDDAVRIRPADERELLDLILQAIREGHTSQGSISHCVAGRTTAGEKKIRAFLLRHPEEPGAEFAVRKTGFGKELRYSLPISLADEQDDDMI